MCGVGVEQNTVNEYGTLVTQYLYIVNTVVGLIPEWGWGGGGWRGAKYCERIRYIDNANPLSRFSCKTTQTYCAEMLGV